jgi:site-specific DNA-methyltransferase (adenine-specific)
VARLTSARPQEVTISTPVQFLAGNRFTSDPDIVASKRVTTQFGREFLQPRAEAEQLLRDFSEPGGLVVDPCGGGFTTAIACHLLDRRCISCDVDAACVVRGQERLGLCRSEGRDVPNPRYSRPTTS